MVTEGEGTGDSVRDTGSATELERLVSLELTFFRHLSAFLFGVQTLGSNQVHWFHANFSIRRTWSSQ